MNRLLTAQEIHNLAMNIVGKDLEQRGFEFIAVNSQLKKNPQFVCVDKTNNRYFVIVKSGNISEIAISYDVIWMETFKIHAVKNDAKVLFASVGLGDKNNPESPPYLYQEYLLQYEGIQFLDVEQN